MSSDISMVLERFVANCQKLQINSQFWQNALKRFRKLNSDGFLTNEADDWLCCAIYSELQQAKMKDMRQEVVQYKNPKAEAKKSHLDSWNIPLTKLLRSLNINIKKFFKRMEHWNWLAQTLPVFQNDIYELKRRLGITLILLKHYNRIFMQLYVLPKSTESRAYYQMVYEFGWLLFLVARNAMPAFSINSLVSGCQVLVCSLELVYVNALEVPNSDIINPNFKGVPFNWNSYNFDIDLLRKYSALNAICELIPELPVTGAQIMKNSFFYRAVMRMFMDQRLLGNDSLMRDLIKDGILEVNLASLNRSYAIHVSDISEIDERLLLKHTLQSSFENPYALKHKLDLKKSRPDTAIRLFGELLQTMPAYISRALGLNNANRLEKSLLEMYHKFDSAAGWNKQAAEYRFKLVKCLYFSLLDKILAAELRRRPTMKVAQLLMQRPRFYDTLIVCCLQLMQHKYESPLQFPNLLKLFLIDSIEFLKIITLVVRRGSHLLTYDSVQHLHELEAQCLDSLIWQKNSQLWHINGCLTLPRYQDVQSSVSKENVPDSDSISICLRKFYQLANQRLAFLCKGLSLVERYTQIWHIFEHSIVVQSLLQQRHLDQLLMCAIYLCVRNANIRISFSDIIWQYRRQPHAQKSIYRAVHVAHGQPTTDIINFYNLIYVGHMVDYVRTLHCAEANNINKEKFHFIISKEQSLKCNGHNTNVFLSEAMPKICMATNCKAKIISEAATPHNLKRSRSNDELGKCPFNKRPNIFRRRPTLLSTNL